MNNYTNLLQRQIKRFLPSGNPISPELHKFLDAVNLSYTHYERDHLLAKLSLEISSNELHQLMENLTEQEARLRAILQSASDGIIVVNENQEIVLYNPVAAKVLGCIHKDELLGKSTSSIKVLLLDQDIKKITLHDLFYHKNQKKFYEISIPHIDAIFELSFSQFEQANIGYQICILRDISQRKLSEKKIGVRHAVTHLLNLSKSLEEIGPKILSTLCNELNWDLAFFWLQDSMHERLYPLFFYDAIETISSSAFTNETLGLSFNKHEHHFQEPLFFSDESYVRMKKASRYHFEGCFIIPFVIEEELIGFIELFTSKKIVEDPEIKKTFHDIGSEIILYLMERYAEERAANLQGELYSAARKLGMSQVANSTLHNVGNALNSLTIVVNLLQEKEETSELRNLPKIASLIKEHKADLPRFIAEDPKGKLLPDYITGLSKWWENDRDELRKHLKQFFSIIQHIQKIISKQQNVDKYGELKEKIAINTLLDDMLKLLENDIKHYSIIVEKIYQYLPDIEIDKSDLVQILENLFLNAIDSLSVKKGERQLTVCTRFEGSMIILEIKDTGIGIAPDHLEKIFDYGFTLKETGHGYGLHNSSKLASELGGKLIAKSEGLGKGASFLLSLPVNSL